MFASVRRYRTNVPDTVAEAVNEGFLPLLRSCGGFVAYYGIDGGDGTWLSVSVFESRDAAERSNELAADWVRRNISPHVMAPETFAGEVVAMASPVSDPA